MDRGRGVGFGGRGCHRERRVRSDNRMKKWEWVEVESIVWQ